ncbi:MAG: DUF3499 family protein [Acidimicrobiales bacterium]|nr:MAG: DUF3499 family protein [Acidimicrobiales bacterium]
MTIPPSRLCSRPLCAGDAQVLLLFDYETRLVELQAINEARDANLMELCAEHADRFRPPQGWLCQDRRDQNATTGTADEEYALRE